MFQSHFDETFSLFQDDTSFLRVGIHRFFSSTNQDDHRIAFFPEDVADTLLADVTISHCTQILPVEWKVMHELQGKNCETDTRKELAAVRGF